MSIKIPFDLQAASEREKERISKAIRWLEKIPTRRCSKKLTEIERKTCRFLIGLGYRQHDVAHAFYTNQGRMSEIKKIGMS